MFRRRYDLPLGRDGAARLVPWIVALMSYLAALALAASLALGVLAWRWTEGVSGAVSVLLPPAMEESADAAKEKLEKSRAALLGLSGVARVEALEAAEVARRLEPWLGAGASAGDLPLPRLLVVRLGPAVKPDLAAMRRVLADAAPGAVVDDHGVWRAEIARLAQRVMALAGFAVLLIALTAAVVVVFAVRSGLAVHRETIEVLHFIGAHDDYITRQFRAHTLFLAFLGGLMGLVLLAATEAFLWQAAASLDPALLPRLGLKPWQWGVLGAVPGIAAFLGTMAIASMAARRTVRRALARLV
jgi:cell division transport system permease protein